MRTSYFPGCSLHSTSGEYDKSFRAVSALLDVDLVEPKKWICCGTTPAHATSRLLGAALPLKNLSIVEEEGFKEVVVPCAACFSRFKSADHEARHDPELANQVEEVIGSRYGHSVKVMHPLEIFGDGAGQVPFAHKVTRPLAGLKVACYYGCLLTRPPKVMQFDNAEYPMSMDRLVAALGATPIDWAYKVECCGASLALTISDVVVGLVHKIIEDARARGADAIAVACPLCHVNLDSRQKDVEKKFGTKPDMPVLFFTQLMGLAMGIEPAALGLARHLVDVSRLIATVA